MERFDIAQVYALHTDPFGELGAFRTNTGPLMASYDEFEITITGTGGHAAYPHACVDPMPCVWAIGQALQTLVSRNTDPLKSLVVSVTQVIGGTARNVIPESVYMAGTVRSTALDPPT